MKNIWKHTAVLYALTIIMAIGINAQPSGGRGLGPCGQGQVPDGARSGEGYGQGYRQGPGQGFRQGPGMAMGNIGPQMGAILDLTEEQQDQLNALRVQHYKEMKPLKAELAELNARKRTLMSQEEVDMKAIDKLIDQQTDLMNTIQKKQVKNRLACREVFTDEQLMKLDQRKMHRGKRGMS